jgi:sugar phosphate isomerase/epimerase
MKIPHTEKSISRRVLLRRSVGVAAFAAAASSLGPLLAAPASRWFKIGACDWALGKRNDPAAFQVAKSIGLDGVQVDLCTAGTRHLRDPQIQAAYRDAARRSGLEIASLALLELNNVPLKSDPRAALWLGESIDVCKALGVNVVLAAFFVAGELDMQRTGEIDRVVKILKQVAPKAERQGVVIGLEDYLSAEDNLRILDRVGSPAVKVYYDVGNSTDKGRDVAKEIRALAGRVCEFHAKDGPYMLGQGRIDFKAVRKAMDDIQYSGWIQIEAATPHGPVADYTVDRKYLKGIFPRQG